MTGCCSGSVRFIESLVDLPRMTDPDRPRPWMCSRCSKSPPFTEENLFASFVCRMAALSWSMAHTDGSMPRLCVAGQRAGMYFGDYQAGFRFGRLGLNLVEKRRARPVQRARLPCFWPSTSSTGRRTCR